MRKRQIAHFLSQCDRKKRMETYAAIIFAGGFLVGVGLTLMAISAFIFFIK